MAIYHSQSTTKGGWPKHKALFKALSMSLGGIALSLSLQAAAVDLPEIESRGYMNVATEDNYAPFNFIADGEPEGFTADMLEELREYADFEIRQDILPWTGLLASVATGQYDVATTGALVSEERLRVFNFVPPYASAQIFYVKRIDDDSINSVEDLSGKRVGAQAGSVGLSRLSELATTLEEQGGRLGEVVEYESYPEAHADLANGRLDFVVDAVVPLNDLVSVRGDTFAMGQAVSGPGFASWPVPKNSPELLEYLTDFMTEMRESGRLAELQEKWFGQSFDDLPHVPITTVEEYHEMAGMN
ncbi:MULTISPECIES: transporter substrate-binding domain-containing protein [Halomonadaceae]|uniref:transporter substrate-binding domain-containing protein n=1 Tax=Halomonadaceae TaxID=28256 RepID=UPI0015983D28|nr:MULTISPECIES: transporter substrate-binding domain-containing protein [Halomonas]QJQ95922.1 transporter substrate-binding domain-containing protein [Halomonas sp. PA5]